MKATDNNLEILDLSNNPKIELQSYSLIRDILENPYKKIRELSLEGNKCGDDAVNLMRDSIAYNGYLKFLNLR